ncbi:PAS domain-containing sensor histidine kinase [Archaeoglobus neptunius]|uniref:PAS domain-containing sensor histidine kinase n=1 Tax=Archaeoglobus neptunius TaxID=2798580 RepID=UPI001925ACD4|nr:PAS domain-containing sensor histidine kinase [Archaeoglobus neptunius]
MIDWKRIIDDLPAGIAIFDSGGKLLYINNRIVKKTGINPDNFEKDPFAAIHPDSKDLVVNSFKKALKGGIDKIPYPLLIKAIKKDGYQWNEVRFSVVGSGKEKHYVLIFTDVSDRIEMQEKINDLLNHLKFLNSVMRHDILNVFTSIYSYTEILEESFNKELLSKIRESIEKGTELIGKIKALELASDGITDTYKISEVVEEVAKGHDIKIELIGDAEVRANDGIYSVFENLIGNAIKHGGASEIQIEVWEDDKIYIRVRDNGTGIPEGMKEGIFERGVTSGSGSGLGLYIVRKLLETYGACIRLEEGFEKGASFLIEFPAQNF